MYSVLLRGVHASCPCMAMWMHACKSARAPRGPQDTSPCVLTRPSTAAPGERQGQCTSAASLLQRAYTCYCTATYTIYRNQAARVRITVRAGCEVSSLCALHSLALAAPKCTPLLQIANHTVPKQLPVPHLALNEKHAPGAPAHHTAQCAQSDIVRPPCSSFCSF